MTPESIQYWLKQGGPSGSAAVEDDPIYAVMLDGKRIATASLRENADYAAHTSPGAVVVPCRLVPLSAPMPAGAAVGEPAYNRRDEWTHEYRRVNPESIWFGCDAEEAERFNYQPARYEARARTDAAPAAPIEAAQPASSRPSKEWYAAKIAETLDDDFTIGPASSSAPAVGGTTRVAVLRRLRPFNAGDDYKVIPVPPGQSLDFDPGPGASRRWLWPHLGSDFHLCEFVALDIINPASPTGRDVTQEAPTDAMVDAYLTAQRATVEEADRFGRPNAGGLHTNTVREACRNGLAAAIATKTDANKGSKS